ncbi:MAG: amino acid ABC transporter permease [Proteobacteria bacterium]|nr:amino acid ABC transporter permease [Pseudomonadota bacterium]MBI3497673.1 amino acid ABC transporter permease [Pseudomonadota bacterium]
MQIEFDWSVLWRAPYGDWVASAILTTIELSLVSWVIALFLGTIIGILRASPHRPMRMLATAHVEVFRNIPLLVQLFFAYYVLPRLLPMELRRELFDLGWEMGSAILTLSLYSSAKIAEHVRAGANAVEHQVKSAALSTGLTWWKAQRFVIMPLLLRVIVPNLTTEFVTIFKSSSIAMTVGVAETSYLTQNLGLQTFHWIEANTLGTMVYLTCAWAVAGSMAIIEHCVRVPGLLRREGTDPHVSAR